MLKPNILLSGLLNYLAEKIAIGGMCIQVKFAACLCDAIVLPPRFAYPQRSRPNTRVQCNRGFGYLDAVRAHMRDKNHVILDVEACAEEVEEYYNLDDDGWEDEVTLNLCTEPAIIC
jgi:hypothetical protein